MKYVFFFQAEDGIRYYKVTGVQTCALPISPSLRLYVQDLHGGANHVEIFSSQHAWVWPVGWHAGKLVLAATSSPPFSQQGLVWRSEERRVGKECRSLW